MTIVSYHSALISAASQEEAIDKTTSQIFLSRGAADADVGQGATASPRSPSPTFVMSVFESESSHVTSLGNAAAKITSIGAVDDPAPSEHSQHDQISGRGNPPFHLREM